MVQFLEVITFYLLSTDKRNEELYSNVEKKSSVCLHTNSLQQMTYNVLLRIFFTSNEK